MEKSVQKAMNGYEWKTASKRLWMKQLVKKGMNGYEWNKTSKMLWTAMNGKKCPKGYEWLWMKNSKSVQKAMNDKFGNFT